MLSDPAFTVTSANADRSLLTAAELSDVVSAEFAKNQRKLAALGLRTSALITKACRVARDGATPPTLRLESVSDTFRSDYHHHDHRRQILNPHPLKLSRRPVVEISSVTEGDTLLTADDYEVDAAAGELYRLAAGGRASWPWSTVIVAYSAGWQTVPYDLRELAAKLATTLAAESGRDPSLGSENVPGVYEATYRYGRPDDPLIPAEIMEGLDRGGYVNHWIA